MGDGMNDIVHCVEASGGRITALRPAPERREGLDEHKDQWLSLAGSDQGRAWAVSSEDWEDDEGRKSGQLIQKRLQLFPSHDSKSPCDPETRKGPITQGRLFQLKLDLAIYGKAQNNDGLQAMEASFSTPGVGIRGSHGGPVDIGLLCSLPSQPETFILKVTSWSKMAAGVSAIKSKFQEAESRYCWWWSDGEVTPIKEPFVAPSGIFLSPDTH